MGTCLFTAQEVHFVVVVPSFNNEQYYRENLDSIFSQDYPNFRVIYINDASTDRTGELVQAYIKEHGLEKKCTYSENATNKKALYNLYYAIHSCKDTEVIVTVDGDDRLAHSGVLTRVSQEYKNSDVWLTYGQYTYNDGRYGATGCCEALDPEVVKNNNFRKYKWCTSHLRTFYAGLFKKIKKEDLMQDGEFFSIAWDLAILFPMLEMAQERHKFISDILYVYNVETPLNDHKLNHQKQLDTDRYIRNSLLPYSRLQELRTPSPSLDLFIFSFDRPMQLYALLESIQVRMKGISHTTVLYRASDSEFEKAYETVKKDFKGINFCRHEGPHDFQKITTDLVKQSQATHLVFGVDDIIVTHECDLTECLTLFEKTQAYSFALRLGKNITSCYAADIPGTAFPTFSQVTPTVISFKWGDAPYEWNFPHSLDMNIYRRSTVMNYISSNHQWHSPFYMENKWWGIKPENTLCLCFETSKLVNIPMNVVALDWNSRNMGGSKYNLLKKFNDGEKINIECVRNYVSQSPHEEIAVTFTKR